MKVNIYVNWKEEKVCTEEEYLEVITEEVEANFEDWGETWLEEHYSTWELFNLQESEKLNIEEQMKDELVSDTFNDRLGYEWEIKTIDI